MTQNKDSEQNKPDAPVCPPLAGDDRREQGYAKGQARPGGDAVRAAIEGLARRSSSVWPRRGHNLLEFCCADGYYLEMFWRSGFDVTGQEQSPNLLCLARDRLKNAAEFVQVNPVSLPFDDRSFDYVACLSGLEFVDDPVAMLREMFRLATRGILLAFPCSWSFFALGSLLSKKGRQRKFFSPLQISSMLSQAEESVCGKKYWSGTLTGPAWSWSIKSLESLNLAAVPLPLGTIGMVRIDFNPPLGMTKILVSSKRSFKRETAVSGLGRVNHSSIKLEPRVRDKSER